MLIYDSTHVCWKRLMMQKDIIPIIDGLYGIFLVVIVVLWFVYPNSSDFWAHLGFLLGEKGQKWTLLPRQKQVLETRHENFQIIFENAIFSTKPIGIVLIKSSDNYAVDSFKLVLEKSNRKNVPNSLEMAFLVRFEKFRPSLPTQQ